MSFDFNINLNVYFDYPSAWWKQGYHVIVDIENNENFGIEYFLICTERETGSNIELGEVPIQGPDTYTINSDPIDKSWTWFLNTPCATLTGAPLSKTFNYDITFTVTKIIQGGVLTPVTENNVIAETLTKIVRVPSHKKLYRARSEDNCALSIFFYAYSSIYGALTGWWCPPCAALAAAYAGLGVLFNSLAVTDSSLANDPIEFDKNYDKIHDSSSLIRKFKVEGLFPIHVKRFGDRFSKIDAYFKSLDLTYNRFFSSLKAEDKRSTRIQKEKAIDLIESIEEVIFKMKNHLHKIKKVDEDFKKAKIKEDKFEETLLEVKEKGISEEFKEKLKRNGLNKEMIERINESSKKVRKDDIRKEIFPSFQIIYHQILDEFIIKKEKIKDMKRVERLSKDALSRRLVKEGLTKLRDYSQSRKYKRRKKEFNSH